ncbi:MAG: alpha/beta hydrolase [Bdellovibrio sp.]|nr:alpha/beta hydrolase [Bdellovibrio sp.]
MKKMNVVFLHGFPFNAASWDSQVNFLSERKTLCLSSKTS